MSTTRKTIEVSAVIRELADRPIEERAFRQDDPEVALDLHLDPEGSGRAFSEAPAAATARWRPAKALLALRAQVDAKAPNRNRASDGTIGDERHCGHPGASSDHCPKPLDGAVGVVTAIDVTHDPQHGCDAHAIAEAIRHSRDPRVTYIISNARIASSVAIGGAAAWAWRSYTGSNAHTRHCHISVKAEAALFDDTSPWAI